MTPERIQINIRFTQAEKEQLESEAKKHHMTMSAYIKYLLFVKK